CPASRCCPLAGPVVRGSVHNGGCTAPHAPPPARSTTCSTPPTPPPAPKRQSSTNTNGRGVWPAETGCGKTKSKPHARLATPAKTKPQSASTPSPGHPPTTMGASPPASTPTYPPPSPPAAAEATAKSPAAATPPSRPP